ncbi:hypothetical protein BaRGS_00038084 [Batillaria attramentaria]|uniref:F-box domain-containing protein n=1 Tax=Batillaria attramentaria TaxID=370345 RepID=A0ABD0J6U2_9CAEN
MPSYIAPIGLTRNYAVRPAAGLRFGNFEGVVHLPPVKNQGALGPHSFSALNNQHIYRTICEWVESWQPWQQKIILYSIINRCTMQQLEILATTLEPLRHRDSMTVPRKHYPSASLRTVSGSKESTPVLKSALKKLPDVVPASGKISQTDSSARNTQDSGKPSTGDKKAKKVFGDAGSGMEKSTGRSPEQAGQEEEDITPEKESQGMSIDQYASLVSSALLVAAIGEIALADKIEKKMLTDIQDRAEEDAVQREPSSVKLDVRPDNSSSTIQGDAKHDPQARGPGVTPVTARETSTLTGILRSASEKRAKSGEEGRVSAQFLGGRISFTPGSRQSRRSEALHSGSSHYRHSAFTSSAASTTDFFQREKISALGPMQREIRTGRVQRPVGLGDIPVAMQRMYKNRGWWPEAPPQGMRFQPAKKDELANNFRDQQAAILGWLQEWESHERLALLKEIAKVCGPGVLEALVTYIHQKLRDACDINRLPDKLLLYVLSFLSPADVMTCAQVCRRWRYLCAMDSLWIVKCLELGEEEGIENVPQLIEEANKDRMGVDWMLAYMELHALVTTMRKADECSIKEAEESAAREAEARYRAAAEEDSLMKRFRIRRWSQMTGEESSSSSKTDFETEVDGQSQSQATADERGEQTVGEQAEVDSAFSEEDLTPFMHADDILQHQPKPSGKYPKFGKTQRKSLRSSVKHKIQETLSEHSSPQASGAPSRARGSSKGADGGKKSAVKEEEEEDTALDIHTDLTHSKDLLGKVVPAMSLEWETPEHDEDFIRYPVYAGKVCTIQRVRKVQGHIGGILCLQFDQRRLVTGGVDHAVRLWDVRSGRSVHKFYGHKGGVRCLRFDTEILVTGSWDSTVMVWNIRRFSREAVLHGHTNSISCLHLGKRFVISGSHDCTVRVWARPTYMCTLILRGHAGPVQSLVADDDYVFSTATDLTVRVTDLLTGQCVRVLERANNAAILCLTMHGSLLLGGDSEGRVYFWNARTGEAEAAVQVHDAAINTITYHNGRFYTGSSDGTMTEYDLMTMTCLRVLRGHKGPVRALQHIATSSEAELRRSFRPHLTHVARSSPTPSASFPSTSFPVLRRVLCTQPRFQPFPRPLAFLSATRAGDVLATCLKWALLVLSLNNGQKRGAYVGGRHRSSVHGRPRPWSRDLMRS